MSTVSPETNANLIRLEHAAGYELHGVLGEILERGEALDKASAIIEKKLSAGQSVTNRNLALLAGRGKQASLYELIKERFFAQNDFEALVILYEEHYPDPEIEKALSSILYNTSKEDLLEGISTWKFAAILPAMVKVGTRSALPVLEAILYEKHPSLCTKTSIANAVKSNRDEREASEFTREEVRVLLSERQERLFVESVSEAVAAIKKRSTSHASTEDNASVSDVASANSTPELPKGIHESIGINEIERAIANGESKKVEFKETLGVNLHTGDKDKKIEDSALKTIVAFLNSEGGLLLIGVNDRGTIKGLSPDLKLKSHSDDKLCLYLKDLIKSRIGEQFATFIDFGVSTIREEKILYVICNKSDTPCFLYEKEFYVRTGPSSDCLEGRKTHEYIQNHFKP